MKIHGPLRGIVLSVILLISAVSALADDYFDQITVFSHGRITRFVEMPITVYITPTLQVTYLPALRYAMRQWEAVSDGKIQFQELRTSKDADILVRWGYNNPANMDMTYGKAELTRHRFGDFSVEIILSLPRPSLSEKLSREETRTVCLHEFGHAIGLWGHSPNPLDVSFWASIAQRPTTRDRATLLKVYSTPQNTPQHDIAINILKEQLETNPTNARTHYLLGTIYDDKGDTELAVASFKNCLEINPDFDPARETLLQVYQRVGLSQQAVDLLEETLKQMPSSNDYNTIGVMYYRTGEIDQSITAFRKSLKMNPYDPTPRNNLYQIFRERGIEALNVKAYQKAAMYFGEALQFKPEDALLYRLMGDAYARDGDLKSAIAQYRRAFEFDPAELEIKQNLAGYLSNYGVELTGAQRWEEAIAAYREALQLTPTLNIAYANLVDVLWKRANTHRKSGHIDKAIDAYLQLIQVDADADAHSLLGELYLKKGAYPQAIDAFRSAFSAKPDDWQSRKNLVAAYHHYAQHLDSKERYNEAIDQLRLALALSPQQVNLRLSIINTYQLAGDFVTAEKELGALLKDAPQSLQTENVSKNLYVARGNTLMNQRRYTAALAEFEKIDASAKTTEVYNTIGYLYLLRRQPILAIEAFESALALTPINNIAYQNLLSIESQFERQFVDDRHSPRIKNHLARARNSLAVCYIGRDEILDAVEEYRAALEVEPTAKEVRVTLRDTGRRLTLALEEKNALQQMREVMGWIQELDADSLSAEQLLDGEN
ncbi:tetratricopeptide repeat protein [Candidatus Poribacteria bacterium]|nr:tetratricopeptide repeat protein [Candidatus Poribacteria bacterium]